MTTLPSTMRAWQYTRTTGGLEKNLSLNPSAPLPTPKPDQHLVRVIAAALNPVDYKPAEIPGVARFAIAKPATPGIDFAGSIIRPATATPSGSHPPLKAGQLVFGSCGTTPLAGGALREFSVANATSAVPIPEGVSPIDAATIGVAGLTAYQSIVPHVKRGDRVFINGGSGGTGVFGIQFAKAAGCHVTTACSTANVELCRTLGADEVVDYKKEKVIDVLLSTAKEGERKKFDHAVDNVGSDESLALHSHEFLRPGAVFVIVGGEASFKSLYQTLRRKMWPGFLPGGVKGNVVGFWPKQKPEDLRQIGEWMQAGKVKAVVDARFPFEEAPRAFEKLKTGRARGKIVVDVAASEETS
ncbi:MAG: hypothetical protein LQ338_001292 [Usnochroma carphineum]|nr:MAG: hypothetical protein LQ338_001292 [Usnochroma carphineum]